MERTLVVSVGSLPRLMADTARLLEFRSPIHWNTRPRNPSRLVGRKEHDHIRHVFRLADSLERLHSECGIAARFRFGEVRDVCVDNTGRNSVHANATRAKQRSPVLNESLDDLVEGRCPVRGPRK